MREAPFKTPGVEKKLFAILKADRWDLLKPFFNSWETEEEMIDKVLLWDISFCLTIFVITPRISPGLNQKILFF